MKNLHSKIILFNDADLFECILACSADDLDVLPFGVIGFDAGATVTAYNALEALMAGLARNDVIGTNMFEIVAPCMNNFLIAERFVDALRNEVALDETLEYVLTLRMRPTPVTLRLLSRPGTPNRYILIRRKT